MQIEPTIQPDTWHVVTDAAAILEQRLSGRERVLVLLDVLQRQTRVELPETWVRLA
jgi:hypothetical protein